FQRSVKGSSGVANSAFVRFHNLPYLLTRLLSEKKSDFVVQPVFALHDRLDPLEHVGERGGIQDLRGGVTYVLHHDSDSATALVAAFAAAHVGSAADARQERQGTVHNADDVPDAYG